MIRTAIPIGLASILGALASAGAAEPLRVTARPEAGPHYVGQAIVVRVEVEGATGPTVVEPPRSPDAEVVAAPPGGRFLVIARRPGTIEIPPFRARSGDRTGASRPTRLAVEGMPAADRTSAFLGGVGPFEVRAEARPTGLRPGQTLDFAIRVSGPAAWGSVRAPDLGRWDAPGPGFRVETLPASFEPGEPAVRTFRYRLRPARAGRSVLPPVAVAAFDPATRRYSTRYTQGIPIRVEESPRFDPARLDYGTGTDDAGRVSPRNLRAGGLALGIAGGSALVALWLRARRRRIGRRVDPRRLARELIDTLGAGGDGAEAARRVTVALAEFLHRAAGRSPGVLTPPEARDFVGRRTLDPELARRAGSLVDRCDRARFGGSEADAEELLAEGKEVLARVAEGMAGRAEGPREAVKTAAHD